MKTIEVTGLSRRFGSVVALDDVSFSLAENQIHGLLGRNGAGKTTLMQLLTGQQFASSGRIRLFGEPPLENARVLDRVCFIREGQAYPDSFRVKHVLSAGPISHRGWDAGLARQLVEEFRLRTGQRVKSLSRGQLSALGVIVGLASRAPITFFDEPYLGLDAAARQLFYDRLLADYAAHPRTVVLSTHLIDEVADLLEHVLVLDQGRVLLDADTESLRGSAAELSGPIEAVTALAGGHRVLHREQIGHLARITVQAPADRLALHGSSGDAVRAEPISLQQLVIRLANASVQSPLGTSEPSDRDSGKVVTR